MERNLREEVCCLVRAGKETNTLSSALELCVKIANTVKCFPYLRAFLYHLFSKLRTSRLSYDGLKHDPSCVEKMGHVALYRQFTYKYICS